MLLFRVSGVRGGMGMAGLGTVVPVPPGLGNCGCAKCAAETAIDNPGAICDRPLSQCSSRTKARVNGRLVNGNSSCYQYFFPNCTRGYTPFNYYGSASTAVVTSR